MAGSHTRKAGDWGQWDFTEDVLLKSVAAQTWYLPLGKQRFPTSCSWWGSSSQLLPSSHRRYQGIAVNQLISNAASV